MLESALRPWGSATSRETLAYESEEGRRRRAQYIAAIEREIEQQRAWLRSGERASQIRKELAQDQRLRWRVFARDGHRCVRCFRGGTEIDLTIDHITPVSLGGDNSESNLQTLCRPCNSTKGVRV